MALARWRLARKGRADHSSSTSALSVPMVQNAVVRSFRLTHHLAFRVLPLKLWDEPTAHSTAGTARKLCEPTVVPLPNEATR